MEDRPMLSTNVFRSKHFLVHLPLFFLFIVTLIMLSACSGKSGYFKMSGQILHMNQGELYVYDTNGAIEGIDTIQIKGGRFAFEIPMTDPTTLVIIFPNYSEQPIFADQGEAVKIKGDASRLKELEVKGTDDNELMSDFREAIAHAAPPKVAKMAADFIEKHPESRIGTYLINTYMVKTPTPDYATAKRLAKLMQQEQPHNAELAVLARQLQTLRTINKGSSLPAFKAQTIDGTTLTQNALTQGTTVLAVWASWSFDSMDIMRALKDWQKSDPSIHVYTINVDASQHICKQTMERNEFAFPTINDGKMLEMPLLKTLGLCYVPDNVLLQNGKVVKRGLTNSDIRQRINH